MRSLESEFQHAMPEGVQSGEDAFELVGKRDGFLGRGARFAAEGSRLVHPIERAFEVDRSTIGRLMTDLPKQLVPGDGGQQAPEVAAPPQHVLPFTGSEEEAPVDRLHDVFRVGPSRQAG